MNLKITLLLLIILYSLATTVSAAIVSSTSNVTENLTDAYTDGYTLASRYNDEFNQGALDTSRWTWIRPNASAWWMSSWYLGMNITDTSLYQGIATSPLLLQDYGGEDITIISKQWFNPTTSRENAGIIIYADDDNFVSAQYFISGSTRKVIIQTEDNNIGNSTTTPVTLSQPHYIKLVKAGTNYSLYYSNDKKTWTYAASRTQPDAMTKIGYVTGGAPSNNQVYYDAFVTDNFITTGSLTSVFDAGPGNVINSTLFMYTNPSDSHVDGYASKDNITWTLLQTDMPNNTNFIIPPEIQNQTVYVRAVLRGTSTSTPILQPITAQSQVTLVSPKSDDFNSPTLNTTLWELIDPRGDSEFTVEGTDTANAFLNITVPCCVKHAPSITNNAPRIMQNISNVDFEIEAKFQSLLTEQYQEEGFIIEESPGNYIRIDFNSDGTSLKSYSRTFPNNIDSIKYDAAIYSKFSQPVPLYLRVNRSGDNWSYRYSFNGATWTDVTNFTYIMNVTKVGVFIGNENSNALPIPKFTGNIDYFFNTASPIIPEDILDTTPPVINVWYGLNQRFGHLGTPQTWINIMGNVSDSSSAIVALNYSLNDGPAHQLVLGKDNLRLEYTNDFNIEESYTNFTCGDNYIDLSANDSVGNVNNTRVNINYSCGVDWPMPYPVNWSTVSDIQDAAQVVDGQWVISNGKVTPTPLGYDRIIAMGNMTWKNYTISVPITLNSAMTVPGANFGIALRWKEHVFWPDKHNGAYPREGWYPLGAIAGYYDSTIFGGKRLVLLGNNRNFFANDTTATQLVAGSTYNFKARAQTNGTNQVFSLKVWEQGAEEPADWTVSGNAPPGALTQGSILFISHYSDVSFGDVAITNLDNQAPPSSDPNGPYTGTAGTAVSFDGSGSFDPDGSIVSYEWDFGDGNSSTGVNPTNIYAQEGTYTVSLKVTDNGGLNATNSTTAEITVIPDVTAPSGVIGLTNISYGPNYINWTWTDSQDPDFDRVMVYLNGSFKGNVTKGNQSYNATDLNSNTSYIIGLKSVDASGNINSSMVTDVASTASLPDTTPPEWSPTPLNQILELGTAFAYTVTATDPLSVTYSINDTVNFAINSNNTGGQITNVTALSKGVYGLTVTATDASGNENPVSITVTVSDTTAPVWNPFPSDQTIQVGTSFSYYVNADDLSVITYSVNNTDFAISGTGLITNVTALSVGAYGLNITATDDSGNSVSQIIMVTVQAEPTYSASGYVFDNNNAGVSNVTIQNGSYQATSSGSGYYVIIGLLNGSYNFSYAKAGFDTNYSVITISGSDVTVADKTILDTTPPARVTGFVNDTPTQETVNLSWNPTDNASFYQIFRDSAIVGATQNTYWNDTGLSSDTTYQYQVRANDSYNNWGLNSTALSVKTAPAPDNTPPASVTNLMNVSSADYINWTWSDPADSDFGYVEVYLDGSFQSNVTKGIQFYKATGLNPNTSYTIGLKSVDTSGNVNSSMVIDAARTARNTITSPVNLIGNNTSEPIVLENQAMIDITTNNSSVSGSITLTVDTNITRLNESVRIANSTFGIRTNEEALNRYVEIDSTDINKSNISSVNLTMFYSDEDISGLDENTLKIYWWNGSIWKPLDPKGKNYSNENGPIVIDIRRNLTANNLTVQLNHFSTFALVGAKSTPAKPCNSCGGSSGGGGGGGGGSSGENASNIELIEKYDMQISRDVTTSYRFTHLKNPVMFVNITGNTSLGIITVSEEVLKSTSSLVKTQPGGLVYKNFNIWVGTSGYATPRNIKEASIKFKVDNTWMNANTITASDIVLVKWNGDSWIELETSVLSKDDTNTFFEGKTITFSPFAIAVKMGAVAAKVPSVEIPQKTEVKPQNNQNSSQPAQTAIITWFPSSGMPAWFAILIILIVTILIVMLYFKWMNK